MGTTLAGSNERLLPASYQSSFPIALYLVLISDIAKAPLVFHEANNLTPLPPSMDIAFYVPAYIPRNPASNKGCIKYIKYFHGSGIIQLLQITPKWCDDFQNFLLKQETISKNTAAFYSRILRTTLNKAVANEIILKNPANYVQKISAPEPEFLNFEEVKAMACIQTDDKYCAEVRHAFLFSCYTGLRIIDIETLTWGKITTNPMQIIKVQEKTKKPVYIPLSKSAQIIIGNIESHTSDELIFNLSSHNRRTSYYYLKELAEKANIKKNIGWHTARRTFATMSLENGAVSALLEIPDIA